MRIVAGRWRGRLIKPPADDRVRPTADRVREAWMSIVQRDIPAASVLDLFAGSGALGLEALSRGARRAEFVDSAAASLRAVRENAEALGAGDEAVITRADAVRFVGSLEAGAYDVAFADPPYRLGLARQIAERWLEVPFARVLGIEHERAEKLPGTPDTRKYGTVAVSFYRQAE
ncbi:MAG: 16S rRNA (guanine(966)-N(2))-methyltransferase RsmD [Gemmatimonadaceae bacterium]